MTNASENAAIIRAASVRRRWLLSAPALITIFCASVGPLLVVLLYSFMVKGDFGDVKLWQFSLEGWTNVLVERDIFDGNLVLADANIQIFWRSIRLALMTTILALAVGFPTAYFIATRPPKSRDLWLLLITIPFWTNLLVRTFAILGFLSNQGFINNTLIWAGVIDEPIQMLFTEFAITLGMFYVYLPLMVLPIYAAMERFDFSLVEAAYDLYASRWRVLRRVIFPIVKPGVIAGSILVFVPSLGAYVTPRVLGGGKQLMLGNLIELQFGQGRNWPLGAALSITLLAIVMGALIVYVRAAGREEMSHG